MTEYPAISLWQPWASLIFARRPEDGLPVKVHETRNRPPPHRYVGRRIAIHAAKQPILEGRLDRDVLALCVAHLGPGFVKGLPMGAFIGTAILHSAAIIGPHAASARPLGPEDEVCGYWEHGRWAWRLSAPQALQEPIEAKGCQGWWTVCLPD